jgi:hypothetical protein
MAQDDTYVCVNFAKRGAPTSDGRNFTQLLTLTPGATPVSTSQSNQVAVNDLGVLGVPTASFAQPSIQGQYNRTNLYLLDGVGNTELGTSTYIIPPIIDSMQHWRPAEFAVRLAITFLPERTSHTYPDPIEKYQKGRVDYECWYREPVRSPLIPYWKSVV